MELNINWNSITKKRTKENKKLDKIHQKMSSSLDYHHNKYETKFNLNRTKIIPSKLKLLSSLKKPEDKKKIQQEIDELINEENDYHLRTFVYVSEYFRLKECIESKGCEFQNIKNKMDDITERYFTEMNIHVSAAPTKMDIYQCDKCDNEMFEDDSSFLICEFCGNVRQCLSGASVSYKETSQYDMIYDFSYKRQTHFLEWLNNCQAKENTDIPKEIVNKIILELKKERVEDLSKLTNLDIRKYLKRLKYNKYYEHSSSILNRINGVPPLNINPNIEKELKIMFNKIQDPFEKHKPLNRKNFLSYPYVLRKFFELLNLKEYLVYFPLLKSREKIFLHDACWKLICNDLNWNFIPSI